MKSCYSIQDWQPLHTTHYTTIVGSQAVDRDGSSFCLPLSEGISSTFRRAHKEQPNRALDGAPRALYHSDAFKFTTLLGAKRKLVCGGLLICGRRQFRASVGGCVEGGLALPSVQ